MKQHKILRIEDYAYPLEEEQIAKYPLKNRDSSKLLLYRDNLISESTFGNLEHYLPDKANLIFNNTKVINARLKFKKSTGTHIEIFCLTPCQPNDYQLIFSQTTTCIWECMIGNLKRWKDQPLHLSILIKDQTINLMAEKIGVSNGNALVRFSWNGKISFGSLLEETGNIPIPPYLNRESEEIESQRYQTVYSKYEGSVAAPTAGLHFTPEIISKLKNQHICINEITLHVGAGTFQPVKSKNALEHIMHSEYFAVNIELLRLLAASKEPVIAIGTTTLRTLESLYWLGVKSIVKEKIQTELHQWEHHELPYGISVKESFSSLLQFLEGTGEDAFCAETEIMVVPGYKFRIVNGLITNFHQPGSTLLLLIAAFVGDKWKDIYRYALDHNFRFLSYGDSSYLWRNS